MRAFKKIKLTPLTQASEVKLKIANEYKYDLTVLPPDKLQEAIDSAMKFVRRTKGAIVMGGRNDGPKHVVSLIRAGNNKNKLFSFPEPNPVRIYYHSANLHLEEAYKQRIRFNDIPATNQELQGQIFSMFFAEMTDGITSLVRTIEGFINQLLSENTTYTIAGQQRTKVEIEYMDLNTKIRDVIPAIASIDFINRFSSDYDNISLANSLRDDLTHLKKDVAANYTNYQMLFKRLLDVDPVNISNSVFTFVNAVRPGYFEEEVVVTVKPVQTVVNVQGEATSS